MIEDADAIRLAVCTTLRDTGYTVHDQPDGTGLEDTLGSFRPDLVVLDLMLPGRDGFELLEVVRVRGETGVIMLTARDGLPDRLRGLRSGADDYVVKPFDLAELTARVGVVLRRLDLVPATVEIDDLRIDTTAGLVRRGTETIELTSTERRLLDYLATQHGRVVSKTKILTAVWGYDDYDANLVEVHISALRRKLEAHGDRILHTVRGAGYVLGSRP